MNDEVIVTKYIVFSLNADLSAVEIETHLKLNGDGQISNCFGCIIIVNHWSSQKKVTILTFNCTYHLPMSSEPDGGKI